MIRYIQKEKFIMYKESERLELKKSLAQLKEGIISLSSMLNKGHEAELYFGINDEGRIAGLTVSKKTLQDVTHEIQNNLKPLPVSLSVTKEKIEDKDIIHVTAQGDDTPYSAYGRYYIRVNDADLSMNNDQLQKYFEEKNETYLKWEETETSFDGSDIDEDLLISYIRECNEKGRMDYVYRNPDEALNKLGLLTENGKLNNAGRYLFSSKKPLTIKLANFPTDSRVDFGEIKEFSGNIFECINEAILYIQNHISYRSDLYGIQREEIPEIPLRAIREIVVNSFAHCSYARKGDFNQYSIFRSYVKIYNPGPIIRDIDPKRFAAGEIGSKIRNPLIASVLYKNGYIESFGTGFDRTFSLCADNHIEYEYDNNEFGFTFIFRRDPLFLQDRISDHVRNRKNDLDRQIISEIRKNRYITIPELSERLGKSEPTIYRHIEKLTEEKVLNRVGSRKTGYWDIINELY